MAVTVFIIVTLILTLCNTQETHDKVNVTTSLGTVTGLHMINSNIEYYSFRGIPYANVTARFKAPTPMTPWQSVVLAFDDGPVCPQPFIMAIPGKDKPPQDEACLYLNIYTPQLPQQGQPDHPKLPVMVFIHGGGFIGGSSSSLMFGPEFFMAEKNVILVTINYRLGLFGFLSTGTKDAQGNAGMKDQVEALKWVKQEITNFGGDPSHVTIFGISAGGASVVLHMLSPMSKGLFHGAIAQSGTAMADWANIEASVAHATRIAEILYCSTENTTTIVNCLSKMSTSAIIQATSELVKEENTLLVTLPVIETSEFYEDAFLPDTSSNMFNNLDDSSSVPLIIGTTKDEGMFMLGHNVYASMDRNLQAFIPYSVRKRSTSEQLDALVQKVRQHYFSGGQVTETTMKGFVDLWTDYLFMYPTAQTVRKLVAKKNSVYLYNFAYRHVNYIAFWEDLSPLQKDYKGVGHGIDAIFLFYSPMFGQNLTDTLSDDYKMTKKMVKLWTTFARTGSPVNTVDETVKDIQWPKVADTSELTYLEISDTFSVGKNYYEERVAFWDQLTSSSDTLRKDEF